MPPAQSAAAPVAPDPVDYPAAGTRPVPVAADSGLDLSLTLPPCHWPRPLLRVWLRSKGVPGRRVSPPIFALRDDLLAKRPQDRTYPGALRHDPNWSRHPANPGPDRLRGIDPVHLRCPTRLHGACLDRQNARDLALAHELGAHAGLIWWFKCAGPAAVSRLALVQVPLGPFMAG